MCVSSPASFTCPSTCRNYCTPPANFSKQKLRGCAPLVWLHAPEDPLTFTDPPTSFPRFETKTSHQASVSGRACVTSTVKSHCGHPCPEGRASAGTSEHCKFTDGHTTPGLGLKTPSVKRKRKERGKGKTAMTVTCATRAHDDTLRSAGIPLFVRDMTNLPFGGTNVLYVLAE